MHKLPLKEHLRNAALYQSLEEPVYSSRWKRRLLDRYCINEQLNDVLYSKNSTLKLAACIVIPAGCLFLVFAAYFGFLPLGQWFKNIITKDLLNIPPISLKEILIFAVTVNCLTFLIMKRKFFS